jgi:phenylpropionate dioxygenase-like ring-hydroxylating dioxygenase large terminal subunit
MKRERYMNLAKRLLHMLDTNTTDHAENLFDQPREAYTSPEIFARERALIFGKTPMFIGMSNEIPSPGNYFTRDIVDTPFLALRHTDGSVRLYLNACSHRGARVALDKCGASKRFTCPYHAWTYDIEGSLVGVPEAEAFEGLNRNDFGLIPLPVAEKYGMIFGCATPGVEVDVDKELGGLAPEFAEWGFENYIVHGEPHVHETGGNWKYAWDTFCENYHFAMLHRNTLSGYIYAHRQVFDVYGRNVRISSALRTIDEMRKLPEDQWRPQDNVSVQYRLYPSVNFSCFPDFMVVYWVMPGDTPSQTKALHITYLPKLPNEKEKLAQLEFLINRGCQDVVQNEDLWVTALSESGMRAPAARRNFVMGRNEPAPQHFNRLFAEQAQYKSVLSG